MSSEHLMFPDALLRQLLEDSGCVIYSHDIEPPYTIRYAGGSTQAVLGLRPDQLIGRPVSHVVNMGDWLANRTYAGNGALISDARARHFSGSTSWVRCHSRVLDDDGVGRMVGIAVVIDELKLRELELAKRVREDALTGLLSRESFLEEARQTLDRVPERTALGIMDLDGFKRINDTLGHPFGDAVLQEVGVRVAALCNDQLKMARLGGDEFGLLVEADEAQAAPIIDAVAKVVGDEMEIGGVHVRTRGSIGWTMGAPGLTTPELMRQADVAMYEAKRNRLGRQRYSPNGDRPGKESLDRVARLARSLERELIMWFQPLVDLDSGKVVAVEALARWGHPERGVRSPAEFLPLIDQGGLRTRFDLWALEAVAEASDLCAPSGERIRLAMNISVDGLRSPQFLPRVRQLRQEGVFVADQFTIELSEKDLAEDLARLAPTLHELRALGVGLSLDDFGTGHSSLIRLRQLPFTEVKIDRSFVAGIVLDHTDHTIVRTTVDLGSSLGLTVVAEGVENMDIAEMLADMRCHIGQGFRFAMPAPLDSLVRDGHVIRRPLDSVPQVRADVPDELLTRLREVLG